MPFRTVDGKRIFIKDREFNRRGSNPDGFFEEFSNKRAVEQTQLRNKMTVKNFLARTKRKFPSMAGATVPVIADETGLMNHEVGEAVQQLKKEGKVKQFKGHKGAVVRV